MGQSIGLCSLDILAYRMHSIRSYVIVRALYHSVHYEYPKSSTTALRHT